MAQQYKNPDNQPMAQQTGQSQWLVTDRFLLNMQKKSNDCFSTIMAETMWNGMAAWFAFKISWLTCQDIFPKLSNFVAGTPHVLQALMFHWRILSSFSLATFPRTILCYLKLIMAMEEWPSWFSSRSPRFVTMGVISARRWTFCAKRGLRTYQLKMRQMYVRLIFVGTDDDRILFNDATSNRSRYSTQTHCS